MLEKNPSIISSSNTLSVGLWDTSLNKLLGLHTSFKASLVAAPINGPSVSSSAASSMVSSKAISVSLFNFLTVSLGSKSPSPFPNRPSLNLFHSSNWSFVRHIAEEIGRFGTPAANKSLILALSSAGKKLPRLLKKYATWFGSPSRTSISGAKAVTALAILWLNWSFSSPSLATIDSKNSSVVATDDMMFDTFAPAPL